MRTVSPHRTSRWRWLVGASAGFVLIVALTVAAWWGLSRETRVSTYAVKGNLEAITLDLGTADATVLGGGGKSDVEIQHVDRFAFGRPAETTREAGNGNLQIRSRCAAAILSPCRSTYRVSVPDNVPLTVLTSSGDVRFEGFRGSARIQTESGNVGVESYCGFALSVRAGSGDVRASAACAPERLELRTRDGDIRAIVPPGRYRVDADSGAGTRRLRGLQPVDDAPFEVLALSERGNVVVEAGP
jgi:hypothetical protein